tara:strand:+ start:57 stop:437 length:381 start_codon:yes stop_codon:yes gene_type:complete
MYYLINNLPDELKMLIYNYIPINVKINLSKKIYINYYDEHYEHIKTILCKGVYRRFSFNTYVEKIIKKDLSFLFTNIIKKESRIWGKKKKYKYKGKNYKNYIDFLKELCQKNESTRCLNLIKYFIK